MRGNRAIQKQHPSRVKPNTKRRNQELENQIVRALWGQPPPRYTAEQLSHLTAQPIRQVKVALDYLESNWVIKLFQTCQGEAVALADSRAAQEFALLLTKNATPALAGCTNCQHHWMLERPDGDVTRGVCRLCSAERFFLSSMPALRRGTRAVVFSSRTKT